MVNILNNMSMRARIAIVIALSVVISLSITGILFVERSTTEIQKALLSQHQADLTSKGNLVHSQVSEYFTTIKNQIITVANQPATKSALSDFTDAFNQADVTLSNADIEQLKDYYNISFTEMYQSKNADNVDAMALFRGLPNDSQALQAHWISNNRHPLGNKNNQLDANDGSSYSKVHSQHHSTFNQFLQAFGYYDIFLVDAKSGDIVYSVFKELDFATNLRNGVYANSGIGEAFNQALSLAEGETFLTDFADYLPSYNSPASFISSPIYVNNQITGILIFQMPIDRINNMLVHSENWKEQGFGLSGETYLVGGDGTLRSESRFFVEDKKNYLSAIKQDYPVVAERITNKNTSINLQPVASTAAQQALAGKSGFDTILDYRKVEVLSAYRPISIGNMQWGLLAEIDVSEAFSAASSLKRQMTLATVLSVITMSLIFAAIAFYLSKTLVAPLNAIAANFTQLNSQDANLSQQLKPSSIPEINIVVGQFNIFLAQLAGIITELKSHAELVASSSTQLSAITEQSSATSIQQKNETQTATDAVARFINISEELHSKSEQANGNAIAAEQCTVENSQQASVASSKISELVTSVEESSSSLSVLHSEVNNISQVLDVINSIADQTNLLALNAAIEAARAGEHGRGFAVVADEVRTLAARTQQSTIEIKGTIETLTQVAQQALESMECASTAAVSGASVVNTVSLQLDQLRATIRDITGASSEVSEGVTQQLSMCSDIRGVMARMIESITEMSQANHETASSASGLSDTANQVQGLVAKFKVHDIA